MLEATLGWMNLKSNIKEQQLKIISISCYFLLNSIKEYYIQFIKMDPVKRTQEKNTLVLCHVLQSPFYFNFFNIIVII